MPKSDEESPVLNKECIDYSIVDIRDSKFKKKKPQVILNVEKFYLDYDGRDQVAIVKEDKLVPNIFPVGLKFSNNGYFRKLKKNLTKTWWMIEENNKSDKLLNM